MRHLLFAFFRGAYAHGAVCLIGLAALLASASASAQDSLRLDLLSICLQSNAPRVSVEGIDIHLFNEDTQDLIYQEEGKHAHTLAGTAEGILFDQKLISARKLRLRSTRNWLSTNGHILREDLLVVRQTAAPYRVTLVNELSLEAYLYGLINKEVLPRWPLEAKKAQAVAARTYAVHRKIERPREQCDMGADVLDQVYGGYKAEDPEARAAVDATRGEVITYRNRVARAYFHSACGGATTSPQNVWGDHDEQDYLRGVRCPYCHDSPNASWTYTLSREALAQALGVAPKERRHFTLDILARDESGRVTQARVLAGDKPLLLRGEDLRKRLGYGNLKNTRFTFRMQGDAVTFSGSGSGHGVGLCQWGAAGMAKSGVEYRRIIQFYYPGTEIKRMY